MLDAQIPTVLFVASKQFKRDKPITLDGFDVTII